jgi:hypothetical protein
MESFLQQLKTHFPHSYPDIQSQERVRAQLISPFVLELPKTVLDQCQSLVAEVEKLIHSDSYRQQLPHQYNWQNWPQTPCLLNCFDFHFNEAQGLKLIEINTNASLYITSHFLYLARGLTPPDPDLKSLMTSFKQVFDFENEGSLVITDKHPEQEGLYFEFLLYREWLQKNGIETTITASTKLSPSQTPRIYNRCTDFYFAQPEHQHFKTAYESGEALFSPNPLGYMLMADKNRLSLIRELIAEPWKTMIPMTKKFSDFSDPQDLWQQRKKFFFKPSQSYGSKAVYSGKGISRKAFERIYHPDFLAQELCPAGQKDFAHGSETHTMKFDLRFYTYRGQIQHFVSRLYQGQATNMRTPLGGLAPILFI